MPPTKPAMSLLFHPKKKTQQQQQQQQQQRQPAASNGSPNPARRPPPVKKQETEDDGLKLPDGPFQEFRLLSSALNGWKYDVMKFDSRKPVDLYQWEKPVRLNRKDLRKDEAATNVAPEAVGPMLGPDGKPVIGADGRVVQVDAEGKPIHSSAGSSGTSKDKGKGPSNAKKRFQKKTRQVFFVPDEIRQLRREERYPWVMEDSSATQNEVWIGQMEETSKSETHAFFMPAANDIFKFVPAHRWYKFQKRLKHDFPTDTANVENMYKRVQKRDASVWLANRGKTASAATLATLKAEPDNQGFPARSLGPGGRKLKTVDSGGDGLFGDDEDSRGKSRARELGEEGDIDEQVFEEEFADDEEPMELDADDEEAKEAEERLKKEYRAANKQRDAGVDESEEEEETKPDKQTKAMQKLIKKREGNDVYDSEEEEENPYASSVEEEEEEEEPAVIATAASAIQEQQAKIESRAQTPKPSAPRLSTAPAPGISPSHSPSLGGHSVVAKRATSPKIPKPKGNISRGNSPLGGQTHLAGSRATSPVHELPNGNGLKANLKRKADDSAPGTPVGHVPHGGNPTLVNKKRKTPAAGGVSVTSEELENMLIEWVRTSANASTRDCIQHFTPYLTDAEKKAEFSGMVKKHAQLKNGVLVLRAGTRAGSAAPSPPATS